MGAVQSKKHIGRFGLRGTRLASLRERRSWLVAAADPSNHCDYPPRRSYRRSSSKQRERRRRLRRAWLCYKGRLPQPAASDGQAGSSVPTPWLDRPHGRSAGFLQERPVSRDESPSGRGLTETEGSTSGAGNVNCASGQEEFRRRPWQVAAYSQKGGPLCMAYSSCLGYMEEDIIAALIHHPLPNEGLALIYRSCSALPLPVEPTLEPSADVLGYVFPGTFFKVLDMRAHVAQASYLLRLKTAEGWLTGASLHIIRLPQPTRVSAWRLGHEEAGATKLRHRVSGFVKVSAAVANRQQSWDPTSGQARLKGTSVPDSMHRAVDADEEKDGLVELEDAISTGWGAVYACRATRFLSFQECAKLSEERTSYSSLGKLISAASMHKLEEALQEATKSHLSNAGSFRVESDSFVNRAQSTNSDSSRIVTRSSIFVGGLSPLEHSFMLFRVVGAHAIPVSATPHLGSPIVGRLLRRQVFPVLDACLVSCIPSCGSLEAGDDCMIAGLGTSGPGESDNLHAMPLARLCGRKAKKNLYCFAQNRRVHLRVCTDEGWVTLDGLIERVDECEVAYDRPVLYEIVADGYLVNVRPTLEIEGQVRRTLPSATLVEVYERKINAEGLVRLRLVDGWINERRKSSGETGFLFATRAADRRTEALLRHLTAVCLLLPALCSGDHRVRVAAASWVAANAAQSAIASSALMEAVDIALVNSAIRPCTCCYCKGHHGDRVPGSSECPPCSTNSPRRRDPCLAALREVVSRVNESAEYSAGSTPRCIAGEIFSDDSRQCVTASSGSHSAKPVAAKELLLAESPVIKSPSFLGSVLPNSAHRVREDDRSNIVTSVGTRGSAAVEPSQMRGNECSTGHCHRGSCFFENVETLLTVTDNDSGGSGEGEEPAGPWISLFSLIKAASALPGEVVAQPVRCSQCSSIQEVLYELLSGQPGDAEEAGELTRSISMPCASKRAASFEYNWEKSQQQRRRSSNRTMDTKVETTGSGRILRKCRTNMIRSSLHPQSHILRSFSIVEFSMGRNLNYENARAVLSPSDVLYQFCVAAVYSSLAEHRESVPPYAVYRPPVGSFVSPSNYTSMPVGPTQQHALLQSYRPYLVMKDGKLTLGSPNRFNSVSFHQPPIFVAHLNEYFLFHGCTEERAGLIALSGFDFRRGGENGGKLFGVGTYFSPHASKADLYTRPNDFSGKATGPSPFSAVTFHISLPTLPFLPARMTQPPVGLPTASSVLTSIPTNVGTGGSSVGTPRHGTGKTCGSLRFGKGGWLASGRGSTSAARTAAGNSAPPTTPGGASKKDKEKGRFRAVCAKLTRQGSGGNTSRSKDSSVSGQALNSQKHSNLLPASLQQKIDTTGGKTQQAGTKGLHPISSTPQPITRCLLLARVCLGEVYKALSPMPDARMPPNKPDSATAKLAYDSVMAECRTRGGVVDGVEFVVFERAQALPEFVITYSHAAHCQCAECHRQAPQ
ncbi:hypothetical protein, conserved [Eimeria praecox]|uniref:PARP catalytic domain-containing protein n=1 Tax=Eimeria praecox TaxID=51316 RepID=U6G8S0_9EIME|nr:hypothetical protein, conserved [Eimeria praecox]